MIKYNIIVIYNILAITLFMYLCGADKKDTAADNRLTTTIF